MLVYQRVTIFICFLQVTHPEQSVHAMINKQQRFSSKWIWISQCYIIDGQYPGYTKMHENAPFWWYFPGKIGIFHGYVSLPEGNQLVIVDIPKKSTKVFHPNWKISPDFIQISCISWISSILTHLGLSKIHAEKKKHTQNSPWRNLKLDHNKPTNHPNPQNATTSSWHG